MTNPSQSNGAYIVGTLKMNLQNHQIKFAILNQVLNGTCLSIGMKKMYTYDTHTQVVTNVFGLNKSLLLSIDKD